MTNFDEAVNALRATGMAEEDARRAVGTLDDLALITPDVNEGQEYFRKYALHLQRQIDEIRKVHHRLVQYAENARKDGDDQRAMAYDESAAQIRHAPFFKLYSATH